MKRFVLAACTLATFTLAGCVSDAEYARLSKELAAKKGPEKCEVTGSRIAQANCEGLVTSATADDLRRTLERNEMYGAGRASPER